jgi:putative phosphoesterase
LKIAIISDIHGNMTAVESVLPEIKDVDRIICLGDVAAVGPQPKETIAFLKRMKWPCVLGNADETLANSTQEDYSHLETSPETRRKMMTLDEWTAAQLDPSDKRFLAGFKHVVEARALNASFLCYHGSPQSNTEGILATTLDDEMAEIFAGRLATVYAGGHTHTQMIRKFGTSMVINPGSVGLPFYTDEAGRSKNPAWAEYAMITISSSGLRVELRRKRYNLRSLEKAVRRSGMPNPDWWLQDWL